MLHIVWGSITKICTAL